MQLRISGLPDGLPLRVLDLLGGNGLLWDEVRKSTGRTIEILRIDKKAGRKGFYLIGDNRKFLFDYGDFDVVDLDAYGCPFDQLEKVLNAPRRPKIIFLTWIQSQWGVLPRKFLETLGYTEEMINKIPTLFNRRGTEKLLDYLALRGIKTIKMYSSGDNGKTYLSIRNDL